MKRSSFIVALAFSLIISLFGVNASAQAAGFTDVPSRALKEVNFLAEGGIAKGSSPTEFGTNKTVNRVEAAVFIGRALQLNGEKRSTDFKDVHASSFASGYIQSVVDKGIISGNGNGSFLPNKSVTRGEMALMITKAFGYSFDGSLRGAEQALMSRGIANGMADGTFGSNVTLSRADFAVFLARAIQPEFRLHTSVQFNDTRWSKANDLNVRSGPSTAYSVKGKIQANDKVLAAHEVGGWTYIKSDDTVGFVSTSYLKDGSADGSNNPDTEQPDQGDVDSRLKNQTIILDPGHGGHDPGAIGFGLREKDVVLSTSLKLNQLFKQTPFKVKMTRSDDRYIKINDRVSYAINNKGNTFVSIHANAASSSSANGTETIYHAAKGNPYVADSKLLASKIQNRLIAALKTRDRDIKSTEQLGRNLGVLTNNKMPATLVELGFITNKKENDMLKSAHWQNVMAKAMYDGVLDYYAAKGYDVKALYQVGK
ncbi:N-acetylmuramoyl-L-alanine amidase [Bacillus sp. FJAT-42315]|uniref:N-acetylmuramoyl-L-alanine amidase n=1 Tax=Bacillus sp. FJAT-42315 TaxID=2014077 RepID=UPI000C234B9F|nr:N-acetylmuramoyl-L-alanine amidase [Bacillus sp. FJAT-42315]